MRILIIEDDPMHRALLQMMLKPMSKQVIAVGSGEEARSYLEEMTPGIILLDIILPGESGLETLRALRAENRFRQTKIFVITAVPGRLTPDDMPLVDRVIPKPFLVTQIRQAIQEALLSAPPPNQEAPYSGNRSSSTA